MSSGDDSKQQPNQETTSSRAQRTESKSTTTPSKADSDDKSANTAQPLAPPPKPSQQNNQSQPSQTPDYFGGSQNNAHFSLEPNPFEQSFGNPSSAETPGKGGGLPSVASLTSPNPLGPGSTPNLHDSLRSGPLSPAMLQGPVNTNTGYFDQEFRNNYPTPTESSLRTGLTPGGGGSMFPAPSPGTAAIFQNLGGVTPGTAEFQRVAAAAARQKGGNQINQSNTTNGQSMSKQEYQPAQQQGRQDHFGANSQEHEAVNSLYMLAQPNNRTGANANQFAANNQQQVSQGMGNMSIQQRMQAQPEQSPTTSRNNDSLDMPQSPEDDDDEGDEEKPTTRPKGKKGSTSKPSGAANGRRKADEGPTKAPAKKRSRGNNGSINDIDDLSDIEDIKDEEPQIGGNGKKMTDEEKRKNFLERNRVAALKCRQRKKQWLANLQTKVEIFTQENDALTQQCSQLREEIINLKTMLLAHKDCPVSQSQGLAGSAMTQYIGMDQNNGNQPPYSMPLNQQNMHLAHMQGQAQGMQQSMQAGQGVQRR